MFKLILAAAVSVLTTTGAAATEYTQGEKDLWAAVTTHSTVVRNTEECDGTVYGLYRGSNNTLTLCTVGVSTTLQWETIRHEGIHLAQDCVDGKDNSTLDRIFEWDALLAAASEEDINFITQAYAHTPDFVKQLELEAFTLEDMSNAHVAFIIKEACS